jgi:hypothetical protein
VCLLYADFLTIPFCSLFATAAVAAVAATKENVSVTVSLTSCLNEINEGQKPILMRFNQWFFFLSIFLTIGTNGG